MVPDGVGREEWVKNVKGIRKCGFTVTETDMRM